MTQILVKAFYLCPLTVDIALFPIRLAHCKAHRVSSITGKALSSCPPTVDTLFCLPARGFRVPPRFLTIALGSFHTLHALHALHLFPSEFLQGPLSDCCAGRRFCHVCQRATLHLRLPILARSFISCRFVAGRYQFVCQRLVLSSILPVSPVQYIVISSYATLPVLGLPASLK